MNTPHPRYTFRGQLHEALSGKFKLEQNPTKHFWTLARLAQLAITNGRYGTSSTDTTIEEGRINFFYNPPWAANVEADVYGEMIDGITIIDSLFYSESMNKKAGEELIVSMPDDSIVRLHDTNYEIASAGGLAIAKTAITNAAQIFFDTVASTT